MHTHTHVFQWYNVHIFSMHEVVCLFYNTKVKEGWMARGRKGGRQGRRGVKGRWF